MYEGEALDGARRLMVYGVTGSGKTTAAARISAATGIAWTAVDDLTWEPGWVQVSEDEQRRKVSEVCARDVWLIDTAYGAWLDIALANVELIVALDYPRWFSLQRLLRRTFARVIDKQPVCNGNIETLRLVFSRESIIGWHFKSFSRKRERIARWAADPDGPRVVRFTDAGMLDGWIESLRTMEQPG